MSNFVNHVDVIQLKVRELHNEIRGVMYSLSSQGKDDGEAYNILSNSLGHVDAVNDQMDEAIEAYKSEEEG
ncbi:MAG: hypothetical protein K0R18_305 [Bacillales bacterium]|jgi:vacuolar-type H+-ATPase subunit I/STV1|nr:hypothetical protein [Bacillales bacterium]